MRRLMLPLLALLVTPIAVAPAAQRVAEETAPTQSWVPADRDRTPASLRELRFLPEGPDALMPASLAASAAAAAATSGQAETAANEPVEAKPAPGAGGILASITFYSCYGPNGGYCGAMSSGKTVYEGAAACGSAYELGERVSIVGDPTGRAYVCEDRGWLAPTQVDVFWHQEEDGRAWIAQVGRWAEVRREP